MKRGSQNRSIYGGETSKDSLFSLETGGTKNKLQSTGKEESPGRMLNERAASKLSEIKFKIMVIRKLDDLSENYKELQGSYKELPVNYISMKKYIETIIKR